MSGAQFFFYADKQLFPILSFQRDLLFGNRLVMIDVKPHLMVFPIFL
jgi:hypothetical protein